MTAAFLQMAGVFSELELKMIRARVKSGMDNAKAKGKQIGRPKMTRDTLPDAFFKHYPLYSKNQVTKAEFARLLNVSRPTLDHWLAIAETEATA
jgi:DNA invertase Pin-like site-specific DNA recombinase